MDPITLCLSILALAILAAITFFLLPLLTDECCWRCRTGALVTIRRFRWTRPLFAIQFCRSCGTYNVKLFHR